jgi:hypothetical protein
MIFVSPEWAPQLRKSIADYLRNATKDPGKSIPHPFRRFVEEVEELPIVPAERA